MARTGKDKTKKYFAVLDLPESAGLEELRKAYHRKASLLHPDCCPGDPLTAEAFKKVNIAYQYLKKHLANKKKISKDKQIVRVPTNMPASSEASRVRVAAQPAQDISMDELVLRLKHSQNSYVRVHAIRAIAAEGGKEASWALLPALHDKDLKVAAEAVAVLGSLEARIAAVPLIRLHKNTGAVLKEYIEQALEKINSTIAKKYLAKIGRRPKEQEQKTPPAAASTADGSFIA